MAAMAEGEEISPVDVAPMKSGDRGEKLFEGFVDGGVDEEGSGDHAMVRGFQPRPLSCLRTSIDVVGEGAQDVV